MAMRSAGGKVKPVLRSLAAGFFVNAARRMGAGLYKVRRTRLHRGGGWTLGFGRRGRAREGGDECEGAAGERRSDGSGLWPRMARSCFRAALSQARGDRCRRRCRRIWSAANRLPAPGSRPPGTAERSWLRGLPRAHLHGQAVHPMRHCCRVRLASRGNLPCSFGKPCCCPPSSSTPPPLPLPSFSLRHRHAPPHAPTLTHLRGALRGASVEGPCRRIYRLRGSADATTPRLQDRRRRQHCWRSRRPPRRPARQVTRWPGCSGAAHIMIAMAAPRSPSLSTAPRTSSDAVAAARARYLARKGGGTGATA